MNNSSTLSPSSAPSTAPDPRNVPRNVPGNAPRTVPFSYLDRQFADVESYLSDVAQLVRSGQFTLGEPLGQFEETFARHCGCPHAIGVGSGTDALNLSLKALGIGPGDEVITTPNTFIATVGAIAMSGATPVFVDSDEGFVLDPGKIEAAVTERTRAILPVHYTGNVADMPAIMAIAARHRLHVVEDACQAIGAQVSGRPVGSWGATAAFSLHPLKNINVWGDGGVIITHQDDLARRLRLLRNHGLVHRDEAVLFGHNSRLDTLQAVIGNRLIGQLPWITERRIANAAQYDRLLSDLQPHVRVPPRRPGVRHVYHLYVVRARAREGLLAFLQERAVEAKVHYPVPVHLQPAAKHLGYREGDFPVCESDAHQVITLPAHQYVTEDQIKFVCDLIREFYGL